MFSLFVFRSTSTLLMVHIKPRDFCFCLPYRPKPQVRLKEILQRQSHYSQVHSGTVERADPLTTTNTSFYGPVLKATQGLQKTMCAVPSRPQFQGMVLYGQACFTQWASIFWTQHFSSCSSIISLTSVPGMSSSDFSIQITCTWMGMMGCWQGHWADNRRGEKPCQPLCVQLLSQFNSIRNPRLHKHRCRWPCKSNLNLAAAQIPHSSWLHWSLFPTWPHLPYPCSGQPGKQCAVFLKTSRSFCGSGKEMGVR